MTTIIARSGSSTSVLVQLWPSMAMEPAIPSHHCKYDTQKCSSERDNLKAISITSASPVFTEIWAYTTCRRTRSTMFSKAMCNSNLTTDIWHWSLSKWLVTKDLIVNDSNVLHQWPWCLWHFVSYYRTLPSSSSTLLSHQQATRTLHSISNWCNSTMIIIIPLPYQMQLPTPMFQKTSIHIQMANEAQQHSSSAAQQNNRGTEHCYWHWHWHCHIMGHMLKLKLMLLES